MYNPPQMMGLFERASRAFRASRMRRFVRDFSITSDTRVLDIGGTPSNWTLTPVQPRLTILNLRRAREAMPVVRERFLGLTKSLTAVRCQ